MRGRFAARAAGAHYFPSFYQERAFLNTGFQGALSKHGFKCVIFNDGYSGPCKPLAYVGSMIWLCWASWAAMALIINTRDQVQDEPNILANCSTCMRKGLGPQPRKSAGHALGQEIADLPKTRVAHAVFPASAHPLFLLDWHRADCRRIVEEIDMTQVDIKQIDNQTDWDHTSWRRTETHQKDGRHSDWHHAICQQIDIAKIGKWQARGLVHAPYALASLGLRRSTSGKCVAGVALGMPQGVIIYLPGAAAAEVPKDKEPLGRRCGIESVRKPIDFRFDSVAFPSVQSVWGSTALRFHRPIGLRFKHFGCQLVRGSSGLIVDRWFGVQTAWVQVSGLRFNGREIQAVSRSNDFRFHCFGIQ